MDHKLIEAIGTGDAMAFEVLIRKYQASVLNFVYKYVGDRFTSEDLAQEVFIRVYRAAAEFAPKGRVSTWIFKIAYNLSLNEVLRAKRMCRLSDTVEEVEERGIFPGSHDPFQESELREELIDSIQRLPENQRAALLLRVNEDLSYAEIGEVLSTSVSSVESLIFRARENLKKILGKKQGDNRGSR